MLKSLIVAAAVLSGPHLQQAPTGQTLDALVAVPAALVSRAEQGDAQAQFDLAQVYFSKSGKRAFYRDASGSQKVEAWSEQQAADVKESYAEGKKWLTKSAEQGHVEAQYELGRRLIDPELIQRPSKGGPNVVLGAIEEPDGLRGIGWLRRAAEQGHVEAQLKLGFQYHFAIHVAEDDLTAASWFRKAADQGNAEAQEMLGQFYENGYGLPQDSQTAFAWYRRAAEQGLLDSQEKVGNWYLRGIGATRDPSLGFKWSLTAAERGRARAQATVAACFEDGLGTPQDHIEAHKWWNLAASRAHTVGLLNDPDSLRRIAVQGRERVAVRLNAEQLSEAQRRARLWQETFDAK